jgi:hypothetical protein
VTGSCRFSIDDAASVGGHIDAAKYSWIAGDGAIAATVFVTVVIDADPGPAPVVGPEDAPDSALCPYGEKGGVG